MIDNTNDALHTGFVSAGDLALARQIAHVTGDSTSSVILAYALAVGVTRRGSSLIDLQNVHGVASKIAGFNVPKEFSTWHHAIQTAKGVSKQDSEQITPFKIAGNRLYTHRYFHYEYRLASALNTRASASLLPLYDSKLFIKQLNVLFDDVQTVPTPRQLLATTLAVTHNLTFITGGPGMGKTWTVRNILALRMIQQHAQYPDTPLRIALAAPTGKAAARMKESLCDKLRAELVDKLAHLMPDGLHADQLHNQLLTLETSTIHRLLGYNPRVATQFRHDEENPLPLDLVVVDEASMIDLALFSKLMTALAPTTQIIILGDPNQLTSVEAGTVLGDICATHRSNDVSLRIDTVALLKSFGMTPQATTQKTGDLANCIVALNKTYRFKDDERIGHFARSCVQLPFNLKQTAATLLDNDIFPHSALVPHAKYGLAPLAQKRILEALSPYINLLKKGPEEAESEQKFHESLLKCFHRFRILCAHRKGDYGVEQMNELVTAMVKPDSENKRGDGHWYGRPIMVQRNDKTTGRFNGDIGLVVTNKNENGESVPTVIFPRNNPDSEGLVTYISPALLPAHETAFAMTIHKSQGSEFLHAMLIFPKYVSPILTRELIYTGVTRAKDRITVVSNKDAVLAGLSKTVQRASGLTNLLQLDEST